MALPVAGQVCSNHCRPATDSQRPCGGYFLNHPIPILTILNRLQPATGGFRDHYAQVYAREALFREDFLTVTTRVEGAHSTAHFAPRFAPLTRVNAGVVLAGVP